MIDSASSSKNSSERASIDASRWCVPKDQHLVFADFDDGIVMFDARVGATHLMNATAAETLSIVAQSPGLATSQIYRLLLERLELDEAALPFDKVIELMWQLENLGLVAAAL